MMMPRKVKKRRQIQTEDGVDAGWEEYFDYIFPQDQAAKGSFKLLEAAARWKKQREEAARAAQEELDNPVPAKDEEEDNEEQKEEKVRDGDSDTDLSSETSSSSDSDSSSSSSDSDDSDDEK